MKKLLSFILAIIMIMTMIPLSSISAFAEETVISGTCGENLTWTFDESTDTLTISGTGDMTDYTIHVSAPWEKYSSSFSSILIDDGVTSIGDYAFFYCDGFKSIAIPNSVTCIGDNAFEYCNNLTSITIPSSVTSIGDDAFYNCGSLVNINVDSNNMFYSSDNEGVLFNKDKTILIKYPQGNTRKSYIIPNSVTNIGDDSFFCSNNLTSVTILDSVTTIGMNAFCDCESLKNVTIGNNLTSFGKYAFYNTAYYNDMVNWENNELYIGNYLIDVNASLSGDYKIKSGTTVIADDVFVDFSSLISVTIPESVINIGDSQFTRCDSLTNINVDENNEYYSSDENGVLFDKEKTIVVKYPAGNLRKSYVIPNSVIDIGDWSFEFCKSLESITILNNVISIGEGAFYYCSSLKNMEIPNHVTSINDSAFSYCESLESLTIGNGVEIIGNWTFEGCRSLTNISIPSSVIEIGVCAFYSCGTLENIDISNSVKNIGMWAFADCVSLKSIVMPKNITSIGSHMFSGCRSLTSVTLYDNIKNIDERAFSGCANLINIDIPESVISIGEAAFSWCESLESITMSNSVKNIYEDTFDGCNNLTDVYYNGTEERWNEINIYENNEPLINATKHFSGHICDYTTFTYYEGEHPHYAFYECECGGVKATEQTSPFDTCEICNPPHYHSETVIRIDPSCTVNGLEYVMCDSCGETLSETTILEAIGHDWSEWEVTVEATDFTDGERVRVCENCQENEIELVPMLSVKITDTNSGVEVFVPNGAYDGEVELLIEEIFDGTSFQIVDAINGVNNYKIFDITTTLNGIEVQPGATLMIRIPLPEGFDPECTFVKHIDSITGEVEDMNARYENGYLVFETTHFSHYAIVEIGEEEKCTISINTPSRTTIRCKDGIILHATVTGTLPENARIVWTANNSNFIINGYGSESIQIISDKKGNTEFTVSIIDANDNVISTDSVEMYSKAGFFDKIGGFFRNLFGTTKIYEN